MMFLQQFAGAVLSVLGVFGFPSCYGNCDTTVPHPNPFLPFARITLQQEGATVTCSLQTFPFLGFTSLFLKTHVGMQFHPLSIGKGGGGSGDETKKKREGSSLINLELEIGGLGWQSCVIKQEEENILFTAAQFQEFYLQVVIFRYLSLGLPVPFHLVLAIWKSFASSVDSGLSPQELVHKDMMDLEPGRCRRTDGKKWRCHGSVVPDQKYCARHMHRGSRRSRKLVEASKDILKYNTEALFSDKTSSQIISCCSAIMNGRISVPISTSLNLTVPPATVEVGCTSISCNSNSEGSSTSIIQSDSGATTSSLLRAQANKNSTRNENKQNYSPGLGFNRFSVGKSYLCNQGNKNSGKASIAAGFGASPRGIHLGGLGTGCSNLSFDNKTGMRTEELRCRRTDGKRWRCSRNVVPYKKYCENHLHRGAKRAMVDSKLMTGSPGASSARTTGAYSIPKQVKNCRILNTNLSISIEAAPEQMLDSDSSSSDATTISDENATVPHILTLSP